MKTKKILLLAVLALFINNFAVAQSDTSMYSNIDTIVIQASKNGLQEKDAPLLVSVINTETFNNLKIDDIGDLNSLVPNLFMQTHGTRLTSPIYIRGIGSRINSPAVGLYVDGIPYFDMGSFNFEMFDVEKIEVLRGPQGTLYGRNTMGGLINVITAQPVDHREMSLTSMYGNYNRLKTVAHYNQPLGKNLIMVLDGAYARSDGFFENTYLNAPADNYYTYAGRMKLQYKPSKRLSVNYVLNYERSRENGYPYAVYDTTTQQADDISYDQPSSYYRDMLSSGLKVTYKNEKFVLQSSSSYQLLVDTQRIDQDFTALNLLFVDQNRKYQTFVEELSIRSTAASKIKWIAGVFGFKNLRDKNVEVYYNQDAVTLFHLPSEMVKYKAYYMPEEGAAAYGQVSIPLGNFNLTTGIRVDYENDFFTYRYDLAMLGQVYPREAVDTFNTYFEVLPKLSLSYRFSDNAFTYLTFAKGYKSGGFNSTFERDEDISFDPEYSYNYEAGVKLNLFDRKMRVNASVFYIDWLNQQVYQPVPSGQGAMLKNAGHSMSRGAELEINLFPAKGLKAWIYGGYDDARYLSYVKDDETDYSGNKIPYIPEYTASTGFEYLKSLNGNIFKSVGLTINYSLVGNFYWNDANTAYQKTYGLLNANIALNTNHVSFGFYGRNLLNTQYNAFYFEALGHSYVQQGNPMQISGFVKVKF